MNTEELKKIAGKAWSIRPGDAPPGRLIGQMIRNGIMYQYFQDKEGGYWYRRYPEYDPGKK